MFVQGKKLATCNESLDDLTGRFNLVQIDGAVAQLEPELTPQRALAHAIHRTPLEALERRHAPVLRRFLQSARLVPDSLSIITFHLFVNCVSVLFVNLQVCYAGRIVQVLLSSLTPVVEARIVEGVRDRLSLRVSQ